MFSKMTTGGVRRQWGVLQEWQCLVWTEAARKQTTADDSSAREDDPVNWEFMLASVWSCGGAGCLQTPCCSDHRREITMKSRGGRTVCKKQISTKMTQTACWKRPPSFRAPGWFVGSGFCDLQLISCFCSLLPVTSRVSPPQTQTDQYLSLLNRKNHFSHVKLFWNKRINSETRQSAVRRSQQKLQSCYFFHTDLFLAKRRIFPQSFHGNAALSSPAEHLLSTQLVKMENKWQ